MKKAFEKIYHNKIIFISLIILGTALTGIMLYSLLRCKHEWKEATCTEPRTCILCDKIEGEPLGHTWKEANCTTPQTCKVCGETKGEALGHTWEEATCTTPKTCDVCEETEGEALGHTWIEATCTTPKTCDICGETEGEALGHTWEEATCIVPKTCNICGITEGTVNEGSHVLDNTGKCKICGRQIGFALNKSNIYQYVKLTNGDGHYGSIARNTSNGYLGLKYELNIEPLKNVKFEKVHLTYKLNFETPKTLGDYFKGNGEDVMNVYISLDENGYGSATGYYDGTKSIEKDKAGGRYTYSEILETVQGYVIE